MYTMISVFTGEANAIGAIGDKLWLRLAGMHYRSCLNNSEFQGGCVCVCLWVRERERETTPNKTKRNREGKKNTFRMTGRSCDLHRTVSNS